ncbi:hypothetical protein JOD57_000516 [Geodermatophilus bullaregiensis]|uniref:Asp23/Gls24 family envelope stress response protein n=1 Tax=Geodermatophilus bullaregiensis TaxID=1564160 RepID=UPI00195752C7|nr:Asp23/Gls24 family envelope stress response protein [Geodermatophilus bullaregiensis]MBM7804679.1 hypothetical protein [Geodermatophilus bullaregiensis]
MALTPDGATPADDGAEPPVPDLLAAATEAVRREDAALPPPPDLLRRVMDVVRAEPRRPGLALVLSDTPGARVEVAEAAAVRVLRAAVDGLGDVRAGACRVAVDATAGERVLRVTLTVTARAGVPLPELTERVRARVAAAGEEALGLPVAAVDVTVADVT